MNRDTRSDRERQTHLIPSCRLRRLCTDNGRTQMRRDSPRRPSGVRAKRCLGEIVIAPLKVCSQDLHRLLGKPSGFYTLPLLLPTCSLRRPSMITADHVCAVAVLGSNDKPHESRLVPQRGAEDHDVFVAMLHHGRIVKGLHGAWDVGLGKDGVAPYHLRMSGFMTVSLLPGRIPSDTPSRRTPPSFRSRRIAGPVGGILCHRSRRHPAGSAPLRERC